MNYNEIEDSNLDGIMENIRQHLNYGPQATNPIKGYSADKNHYSPKSILDQVDADTNHLYIGSLIGEYLPPMHKQSGIKRIFAIFVGRIFLRVAQIITKDIREFNASVVNLLNSQNEDIRGLKSKLKKFEDQMNGYSENNNANFNQLYLQDDFYSAFEEVFRGTREDIKSRVGIYLPIIKDSLESNDDIVVDLGCGRGEWLELIKDSGYKIMGVDLNDVQLKKCNDLGLSVVNCDALQYLRMLESNSVSAITGFQILEHLAFDKLIILMEECYRVLKINGVIIFETPNSKNIITGASNFYIDPTHTRPLHPETLKFLAEFKGFNNVKIIFANESHTAKKFVSPSNQLENQEVWDRNISQLNGILYGAQDYAIVGYKR